MAGDQRHPSGGEHDQQPSAHSRGSQRCLQCSVGWCGCRLASLWCTSWHLVAAGSGGHPVKMRSCTPQFQHGSTVEVQENDSELNGVFSSS